MSTPKLSVVIPLYNKEPYIARALRSVCTQTVQDFEIIVVDDGSTDNSAQVVLSFGDSRIRLIKQENSGQSVARNRGVHESRTELVAFLDADDEWKPCFLQTVLHLKDLFPQAGIYACAYDVIDAGDIKVKYAFVGVPSGDWEGLIPNYFETLQGRSPVWSSAVMIPKGVLINCGMFPVGYRYGEDVDTWIRIALQYPIAFSNVSGAIYHRGTGISLCDQEMPSLEYPFFKTISKVISEGLIDNKSREFLNEFMNNTLIQASIFSVLRGQGSVARKNLLNCQTKYFQVKKWKWIFLSFVPVVVLKWLSKWNHSLKVLVK